MRTLRHSHGCKELSGGVAVARRAPTKLPLAGPAQRQARAATDHMHGRTPRNRGVIGSSVVQVFDYTAAATGLNEKAARAAGLEFDFVYVIPADSVAIMPST